MKIEKSIIDGNVERKGLYDNRVRYINPQGKIKYEDELDYWDLNSGEWEVAVWNNEIQSWVHKDELFEFKSALDEIYEVEENDSYEEVCEEQEKQSENIEKEDLPNTTANEVGKEGILNTNAIDRFKARKSDDQITKEFEDRARESAEQINKEFEDRANSARDSLEAFF